MIEYIVIGWILFVLSVVYSKNAIKNDKLLLSFLFVIAIFIVGCRYHIGSDWENYRSFYYTGIAEDKVSGEAEPLFSLTRNVFYGIGVTHALFFAFLSFGSFIMIQQSARQFKIDNVALVFLCYFGLFFCNYQFNIVRHGILASCVWLSYSYLACNERKSAIVWALVGCGFHYIGFLFLVSLFVIDRGIKRKNVVICLGLSFLFYFLGIGPKIVSAVPILSASERFGSYFDSDVWESYGLSVGLVFNMLLFSYLYFFKYELYERYPMYRILLNALLLACISSLTLNAFGAIVSRVANLFNMSLIFILPLLFKLTRIKSRHFRIKSRHFRIKSRHFRIKSRPFRIKSRPFRIKSRHLIIWFLIILYLCLYFNRALSGNSSVKDSAMYPYKMKVEQLYNLK